MIVNKADVRVKVKESLRIMNHENQLFETNRFDLHNKQNTMRI